MILLLVLAGCQAQDASPPAGETPADTTVTEPADPLAQTRLDTLWIEGMAEPMELHLYQPAEGFPLPFHTYLPPDWRAETIPSQKTVVFTPDGPLADRATLSVRIYPAGMTPDDALERLRVRAASDAQATSQTAVFLDQPEAPWALAEAIYTAGPTAGHATLTRQQGRYMEIIAQYPVEAGDGFAPREALILSKWRWADGTPLTTELQPHESRPADAHQ
jgi:hypothetical protein